MNRNEHKVVCATAGVAYVLWEYFRVEDELRPPFPWRKLVLFGGVGYLCPTVPDLLEPATDPNHRKIFHSMTMFVLMRELAFGQHMDNASSSVRDFVQAFATAYLSHLAADATKQAGLPLSGIRI